MANTYGVANPANIESEPSRLGVDLACPAGTETTFLSATFKALDPSGVYFPMIWFNCFVVLGATPPSALTLAARIGAGADFNSFSYPAVLLVANANLYICCSLAGPASVAPWQGAGSAINLTCNPTGQAVTMKGATTYADILLLRAPDQ